MEKRVRPKLTKSESYDMPTTCGSIYITPGWDVSDDALIEVFAALGKAGSCPRCLLEAITRSISLGLRYGIPVDEYIEELEGLRCPSAVWEDGEQILSCPDAIAKVLDYAVRNNHSDSVPEVL